MVPHERPGELLVGLELRGLAVRSDAGDLRRLEDVHDPRGERSLRTGDREFDRMGLRPLRDPRYRRAAAQEDFLRHAAGPWVLIRHCRIDLRIAPTKRLDDRVLATSPADDEDPHGRP